MLKWVTVRRAAPVLDMTDDQIYRAIRQQKFPFRTIRIGKLIRVSAEDLGLIADTDVKQETRDQEVVLQVAA